MPPFKHFGTGVYKIVNKTTGKVYVGSAASGFENRKKHHWKYLSLGTHGNDYLQKAWNKYGVADFRFEIIEKCPPDQCLIREQVWIDFYEACNRDKGYNICPTAGSRKGTKWSDETRAKFNATNATPETRERRSLAKKGKPLSPASIRKRTAKQRGIKRSELARLKLKAAHNTEKMRKKKSEDMKAFWANMPPEERSRRASSCSMKLTGRKLSEEACKRNSEGQIARFSKPEERLKAATRMLGKRRGPYRKGKVL